ncbi:geraniol 8-hydroxylase-like protein [Tanacetum coccineum]
MLLRVREEVCQKLGKQGKVKEYKVLDLPYLQDVIKETIRLHLAAPLLGPHKTMMDVKIGNYTIPTNTQILVNAWAMARDPRRRCPALPLAHRMVSLIRTAFVYHFDWKLPHPKEEMDMNEVCGLTLIKATPLVATPIPFKRLD